jgi:glucose uptake protein GlcU
MTKWVVAADCTETALGCIPYKIDGFATWFLSFVFGIAGGIAFLLMVYGFILVATSSGDEKKLQGAKETITSAITGLLVSIFALFIFRLIAIDILHIPGIN